MATQNYMVYAVQWQCFNFNLIFQRSNSLPNLATGLKQFMTFLQNIQNWKSSEAWLSCCTKCWAIYLPVRPLASIVSQTLNYWETFIASRAAALSLGWKAEARATQRRLPGHPSGPPWSPSLNRPKHLAYRLREFWHIHWSIVPLLQKPVCNQVFVFEA